MKKDMRWKVAQIGMLTTMLAMESILPQGHIVDARHQTAQYRIEEDMELAGLSSYVRGGQAEGAYVSETIARVHDQWQQKKQEEKQRVEEEYKKAILDEERIAKRAAEEEENRKNDNNIRVAPGKNSMYFTDPDTGKIIYLENITKLNTVCHNSHADNAISNLYIAKYMLKRNHSSAQNLADNKKIAFELTEDEINNILKNKDERLNLAVRMFFSEGNTNKYINNEKLGDRHIGYLKDTEEGYRVLLASNTCVNHLNSLNLELLNNNNQNPTYGENIEPR